MPVHDHFDRYYAEKLWNTIPEYYREQDGLAEPRGVLRGFIEVLAQQAATLRRSTAAARRSLSTSSTCAAPRDSASSPSAPEPAHRSSTAVPSSPGSCASAENSASRTRSDVGRVPDGGTASRRPPAAPATIRVTAALCPPRLAVPRSAAVATPAPAAGRRPPPAAPCRWPAASPCPPAAR